MSFKNARVGNSSTECRLVAADPSGCSQPARDRAASTKQFIVLHQSPLKTVTQYTCDSGYYMIGSAFSYCEHDGERIQTTPLPECQGKGYSWNNRAMPFIYVAIPSFHKAQWSL